MTAPVAATAATAGRDTNDAANIAHAGNASLPHAPPTVAPRPIADLLTVVITTSPTPSAPATDLLAAVLASFRVHAPPLLRCPVVVVMDAYDRVAPRSRLKRGSVTPLEAHHYDAYKANVRRLVERWWRGEGGDEAQEQKEEKDEKEIKYTTETGLAEFGSPFLGDNTVSYTLARSVADDAGGDDSDNRRGEPSSAGSSSSSRTSPNGQPSIVFVEPAGRLGFGLAVRTAVRAATTPYVWVQQHDWTLEAAVPLAAMLDVMRSSEAAVAADEDAEDEQIRTRYYSKDASSSFPSSSSETAIFDPDRPVPVRYICLPSVRMLRYAASTLAIAYPTLRALTTALKRDAPTASSLSSTASTSPDTSSPASRLPLTPLFLWHDKPHIASTAHYLDRIFSSRLAVGRGDFLEDHIGQRLRDRIKYDPAAWRRFACWLYYPDDGRQLCLRHLQGRTWRGTASEQAFRTLYRGQNQAGAATAGEAEVGERVTSEEEEADEGDKEDMEAGCQLGSFSSMTL